MRRSFSLLILSSVLVSCRDYDLSARLADQDGLIPADQFARYGREQAQVMAVGREYAHSRDGSSAEELVRQAEAGTSYARTLPDVIDARADPLGFRQTLRLKSGWLTMVTLVDDGKRGAETAGLPTEARPGSR